MLNLDSIAHALGGEVRGDKVVAPGFGHSKADRSLAIWITSDGKDIRAHSLAGDDDLASADSVREQIGLPRWDPGKGNGADPVRRMSTRARAAKRDERVEAKAELHINGASAPDPKASETIVLPIPAGQHPRQFRSQKLGEPAAVYTYRDAEGRDLGYIARFDTADGKVILPTTLWRTASG